MGLILKIKSCLKDCKTIEVRNITGFYDADTNPGGFGTPNPVPADLVKATLKVTINGTEWGYDVLETIQDAVFPNYLLYTFDEPLVDGMYHIVLEVEDEDENVYKTEILQTCICNVTCCVDKKRVLTMDSCCDDCKNEALEDFTLCNQILETLEDTAKCLGESSFLKQLKKLQKLCKNSNCGCS